jgi:exonuclease SbcC
MQVRRLRLVNFRQHEETDLAFDLGLTGIIGPNGSGKTTLLEALAWAIYGTDAARGKKETIRRRNAAPRARVEVELEFALGAHRYRVVRSLHGAELYQDGAAAPIANSPSAVSERLIRILGMTRDEFFNTYFTGQKELAIMRAMRGATERAQFLSRVLGYERLALAQQRLKEERTALRARLQDLEARLVSPVQLAEEEAEASRRLEEALAGARAAGATLADATARLDQVRPDWERLQAVQERVRSLESDLRVAEHQVTDARDTHRNLDRDLAEALTAQSRIGELEPLLRDVPALIAERERLDGLALRVARWREQTGQVQEMRLRLQAIDQQLADLPDPGEADRRRAELEATRAALERAEEAAAREHTAWVRDLQDARTQLKQLTEQYQDLKTQRDRLEAAGPDGVCPTCGRPLGATFREVMDDLERQLGEVTLNGKFYRSRVKQLEKEPEPVAQARLEQEQRRDELGRRTEAWGRLEGLEQTRSALLQERETQLGRLRQSESQLADLTADYDERRHEAVRADLDRLEPLRMETERLRATADRAARLAGDAAAAEAELSRREARVLAIRQELATAGWSAEAFAAAKAALDAADRARQEAERDLVRAEAERRVAEAARQTVQRRREERERGEGEARRLELTLLLNQELDRAVSDLRTDLNDAMRPDLSDLGSRFLRDLTVGRFTELELDDDYQPVIVEDGEPQTVLSGGEEDVVSLSLRLAISQMIAERAGQPLSLLILDEIFGSLDEERRTAVVDLLRRLADRFPQVILITHVETVREGFDRVLRLDFDLERGVTRVREEAPPGRDAAA